MKTLRWIIAAVLLLGRLSAATTIPIQVDSATRVLVSPTNAWTANKAGISNALTLGTLSQQNANSVAITGGSISGITALPIASGGTGATNAAGALANLGAGSVTSVSVATANGIFSELDVE